MSRPNHYAILRVERDATAETIRRAFRRRLLEVHPDKASGRVDPVQLDAIMHAFEVLGDPHLREDYDRLLELRRRHEEPVSRIPHVTESHRPADRARAIFFLLVEERPEEALARLRALEGEPVGFLEHFLAEDEFIDAAFLIGEVFEKRRAYFEALGWYRQVLRIECRRRFHRPCHEETIERVKRILIQRIAGTVDARTSLEYLRQAENLGLDRAGLAEVSKRRAQCYLNLEMRVEAGRQLRRALELQPQIKGIQRLRESLKDYL